MASEDSRYRPPFALLSGCSSWTASAVYEADGPLLETWPFLLIARTGRFVTAHASTLIVGCDMS